MRDKRAIIEEMGKSIRLNDPTLDVEKGVIPDVFIDPTANQIEKVEGAIELIRRVVSSDYDSYATTDDINLLGRNMQIARKQGTKARYIVTFIIRTIPVRPIIIPTGILVGTQDGTFLFSTTQTAQITSSNYLNYFNQVRQRIEVPVEVASGGVGSLYNIVPSRINTMFTPITNVSAVVGTAIVVESTETEDNASYLSRIRKKLKGIDGVSRASLDSYITNEVGECAIMYSNHPYFDRYVELGADCFLKNERLVNRSTIGTNIVYLRGAVVSYSASKEVTEERSGVEGSADYLIKLTSNGEFKVDYVINAAIEDAHALVTADQFGFDLKFRTAKSIDCVVGCICNEVTGVTEAITAFFKGKFNEILKSEDLASYVRSNVPNLNYFAITTFCRAGYNTVELIQCDFSKANVSVSVEYK